MRNGMACTDSTAVFPPGTSTARSDSRGWCRSLDLANQVEVDLVHHAGDLASRRRWLVAGEDDELLVRVVRNGRVGLRSGVIVGVELGRHGAGVLGEERWKEKSSVTTSESVPWTLL